MKRRPTERLPRIASLLLASFPRQGGVSLATFPAFDQMSAPKSSAFLACKRVETSRGAARSETNLNLYALSARHDPMRVLVFLGFSQCSIDDRAFMGRTGAGRVFISVGKLPHGDLLFFPFTGSIASCPIHSLTSHCAGVLASPKAPWHIDCYFAHCSRCTDSRCGDGEQSSGFFFCLQAQDGSLVFAPAPG